MSMWSDHDEREHVRSISQMVDGVRPTRRRRNRSRDALTGLVYLGIVLGLAAFWTFIALEVARAT